jgi:glycosyltransferase involved in cell wall biosynthesis
MKRRLRALLSRPSSVSPTIGVAAPAEHLVAWQERAGLLRAALTGAAPRQLGPLHEVADLGSLLRGAVPIDRAHVWLALSVLTGRFPDRTTVVETTRSAELDDGASLWRAVAEHTTDESAGWRLRVATSEVLVDVAHTVSSVLTTGIQRVARETSRRWLQDHGVTPVSWSREFQSLRELTPAELDRLERATAEEDVEARPEATVVVPWRCTYLMPELAAELTRTSRLLPLAELTPNRTGAIGFDLVPVTSAETTHTGFAAGFAANLAALRSFDRLATISGAATTEYGGWASSLGAVGMVGPLIETVGLPVESAQASPDDVAAARTRLLVGSLPLVLVVGSHEPRKNHLAVLHAAELLWREGLEFSLSFVGGNSWGSEEFTRRLGELQGQGRPVDSESRLPEGQLWAAYRLAYCTVFPSLNEGYGLPVAESLAAGTPAITSNVGSMQELADGGGVLTVDPHDDHAIAAALRDLLHNRAARDALAIEALGRPGRSWDTYAAEAWAFLTDATA